MKANLSSRDGDVLKTALCGEKKKEDVEKSNTHTGVRTRDLGFIRAALYQRSSASYMFKSVTFVIIIMCARGTSGLCRKCGATIYVDTANRHHRGVFRFLLCCCGCEPTAPPATQIQHTECEHIVELLRAPSRVSYGGVVEGCRVDRPKGVSCLPATG